MIAGMDDEEFAAEVVKRAMVRQELVGPWPLTKLEELAYTAGALNGSLVLMDILKEHAEKLKGE